MTVILSRRRLLKTGLAAGCVGMLGTAAQGEQKLPDSIQALRSMRDEVHPITTDEYRERVHRAQELMTKNGLDAIVLASGASLRYFAGFNWWGGERLMATVLPAKGEAFFVVPAFEEARLREQLASSPFDAAKVEVRTWQEDENPYALVAAGLKGRGVVTGAAGIEETVPYVFSNGIAKAAPALQMGSATPVTAGCRMTKSPAELELMTVANQATWLVYRAVFQAMNADMTQHQVSDLIDAAYGKVGFEGGASVQTGRYTALPHGSKEPQVIGEGSPVMIDDGCLVEGYSSDITRTFVLGRASDKQKKVFEIVQKAQKAGLAAARLGVACGSVDAAARKVITDGGFGPDYKFFSHRLGHGIGLQGHEWPYLVRGNTQPLMKGMTFSDEPGIYVKGEFGVRLEDDFYVTENGAEAFTTFSPSIEQPFG
ncbi:MAG TPA: Xaa-Pro peptidase family protein [Candidatus Koribacter sp.]